MKKYILPQDIVEELIEGIMNVDNPPCPPQICGRLQQTCEECWERWFEGYQL